MQIAIVATAYNNRVPLIEKYTAARDFLEAGLIKEEENEKLEKQKDPKPFSIQYYKMPIYYIV
ncbi:MAG UNVERIFIED_CONTAM: hypothetical protein LVT10_10490 [Anaerolineae bacterium]